MTAALDMTPRADAIPITTIGEQAQQVLSKQYHRLLKLRPKILKHQDPEDLHQMRITLRRIDTALQVFDPVVKLPKRIRQKKLKSLGSALGQQRDLDVLIALLQDEYHPQLVGEESLQLQALIDKLSRRRHKVQTQTRSLLDAGAFKKLKTTYGDWLSAPDYTPQASYSLSLGLPVLLSPLLSTLLMHPGWLMMLEDPSQPLTNDQHDLLHNLRKTCKQVRYQSEFFAAFYGEAFQGWLQELKALQQCLGSLHDLHVLHRILSDKLPLDGMPQLRILLQRQEQHWVTEWDQIRHHYLNPAYRRDLYEMILVPKINGLAETEDTEKQDRDPLEDSETVTP